ncbi:MAG TPA: hotdog fold thioesterase [Anaeromyxobacteraceae bacterium]|nr:hotdog fold thioesterase [Anaeromyxobacteraceae bacterium]
MSRRPDALAAVRALMARDRFAAANGVELTSLGRGRARTAMRVGRRHMNGVGTVQGGAIFTLADLAFAAACNSNGTVAVALDVAITFARPGLAGTLTADARQVSLSRRVSVCEIRVTDGAGELVALFRGTAFRKDEPVEALLGPARPQGSGRSRPTRRRK